MKETKTFNKSIDVSKLQLKKGEAKLFRVLGIHRDQDYPDRMVIPATVIVPKRDLILNSKGVPTEIACISRVGANDEAFMHKLNFRKENAGTIKITGGTIADQQKYEYLMLCNYRSNNPNRDDQYPALFELIDPEANANRSRKLRAARLKAMDYADGMTDDEIKTFVAANNGNTNRSMNMLREDVENMAESNSEHFLKVASNRHNIILADITNGIDNGILAWDKVKSQIAWAGNGELICKVPRSGKGTHLDSMLHFILNTDNGEAVYDELKALLADKSKEDKVTETVEPNPKTIAKPNTPSKKK